LDAAEFVVVTGPSGAGKSTVLHIAGGLDAPDSGSVAVAGQDVRAMSAGARAAFRRRYLGFVFQFFNYRLGRRAERFVAVAVDDLVRNVVAPRHWRHAG
jgi:ABC-type lipoprotein export system ATPase subunit